MTIGWGFEGGQVDAGAQKTGQQTVGPYLMGLLFQFLRGSLSGRIFKWLSAFWVIVLMGCLEAGSAVRLSQLSAVARLCEPKASLGSNSATTSNSVLKLVSFNLYNRPWDREIRLKRIGEVICELNADVLGLQEVSRGLFSFGDVNPVLSNLGYGYRADFVFARRGPFFETGLSVLSRWPIREAAGRLFERSNFGDPKGFMLLVLETNIGPLVLVNTHLSSRGDEDLRLSQAKEILKAISALPKDWPVVVTGDFNSQPDSKVVSEFYAESFVLGEVTPQKDKTWAPYPAECNSAQSERLDYIWFRALGEVPTHRILGGGVIYPQLPLPSDHCPVWLELGK